MALALTNFAVYIPWILFYAAIKDFSVFVSWLCAVLPLAPVVNAEC